MVVIYGEILADLIGQEVNGLITYERYVGGAPYNVAVSTASHGSKTVFYGAVGSDLIGTFLVNESKNIENLVSNIEVSNKYNTTLAFVENDKYGERSFSFYRQNTADYHLENVSLEDIKNAKIVHLGSLMLSTTEGLLSANRIINEAKSNNKLLSFDVNYRDDIFDSKEKAISIYKSIIGLSDIVKFSEEELVLFTGLTSIEESLSVLAHKDQMIFVSLGASGSLCYLNGKVVTAPSIKVSVVDTTGAGDAFYAAVLHKLNTIRNIEDLKDEKTVEEILKYANVCGALATTKRGAQTSKLKDEEIYSYIKNI